MLLLLFDSTNPKELVGARLGSPLAIGVGESEYYFGSDATPFLEFTKRCVYLNDDEMANCKFKKRTYFKRNQKRLYN